MGTSLSGRYRFYPPVDFFAQNAQWKVFDYKLCTDIWCYKACKSWMNVMMVILAVNAAIVSTSAEKDHSSLLREGSTTMAAYPGQTVTLPCKVSAVPYPRATWMKDGSFIGKDWKRFRSQKLSLHIRNVVPKDSGLYQCKAVNGYGTNQFSIHLLVQEKSAGDETEQEKPVFSEPVKMRRHNIFKRHGSTVTFKCKARGKPRPTIRWYKYNRNTSQLENFSKSRVSHVTHRPWALTLHNISPKDSGRYMCQVSNSVGEIHFEYTLEVIGNQQEKPVFIKPHPINVTVREDERASLQCHVRSVVPPTIKWIKRIGEAKGSLKENWPNNSLQIGKNVYSILPPQESMKKRDGTYLNKLVIQHVSKDDDGMYICLGANTMGYNFRYAFLTVLSRNSYRSPDTVDYPAPLSSEMSNFPLSIIVGVPAAVGLIVAFSVTVCCLQKREASGRDCKYKRRHDASTSTAETSSLSCVNDSRVNHEVHQCGFDQHNVPVCNGGGCQSIKSTVHKSSSTCTSPLLSDTGDGCYAKMFPVSPPPPPPPPSQYSPDSSLDDSVNSDHCYKKQCYYNY